MHMYFVGLYKGQVSFLLDKTGYVLQETRPKFIESQHFYFLFFTSCSTVDLGWFVAFWEHLNLLC